MFLWNVRNTIMKLKPATLLKKISNLFISFIFSAIFGQHLSVATFIIWVCKRKKNSVEKDFSCGICVCKKGKNTDETWQEKDLSKAIHDHGKATLFESIYKVEKVGRSDWKCKSSVFYFLFELQHIVFWKLVLLISATALTSGIFTHTPTNVGLTLSVAVWVWTLPLKKDVIKNLANFTRNICVAVSF